MRLFILIVFLVFSHSALANMDCGNESIGKEIDQQF